MRVLTVGLLLFCAAQSPEIVSAEDNYSFDDSETEKKPYHLGGYIELKPVWMRLDPDASLYKLKFYNRDEGNTTAELNGKLQLEGTLEWGIARLFVRPNLDYRKSYLGESLDTSLYEGYLSLKPTPSLTVDAGKKTLRWGKGYAWNPVAFLDRPKNPDDPELSLEGFVVTSADYIRSFAGPLQTVSFTPVLLPVFDRVNEDFGKPNHWNVGGRLYALFRDTDLDFLFLSGGSKTNRYGIDFSRNLGTNFEIHGELAYVRDAVKAVVDQEGKVSQSTYDAKSYLLGIRYLTEIDTTYIFEYYHNGTGYDRGEIEDYFSFIDKGYTAYRASGNAKLLQKAASLGEGGYVRPNSMRDYLYARVSQKEPFDILYFTPAAATIVNLEDRSFSLSPELLYTGVTNLELRLKATFLQGRRLSEHGEKQNDSLIELRARFYF